MKARFILNGERVAVSCHPLRPLIEVLRSDFRLKGTKGGCGAGECGNCLVFLDELLVNSCLLPVYRLEGKRVTTIEGFVKTREYLDIEKAFLARDILSCGLCTPSLILAVEALLARRSSPTEKEIAAFLEGNLCSYSGSLQIIKAVSLAAETRKRRRGDVKRHRTDARP
ncbi:MAG: (2Fe-2S)-binding protein [Spirochaetales bacterium]|nr:(2Fe-2S)-binding protein [Spirochaetales bacterium]